MTDKIDTPESVRECLQNRFLGVDRTAEEMLERYAGSLEIKARRANNRTHSDKCWLWHHECAVAKIEQMTGASNLEPRDE